MMCGHCGEVLMGRTHVVCGQSRGGTHVVCGHCGV